MAHNESDSNRRSLVAGLSYVLMLVNLIKSAGSGKEADMKDPFKIGEEYYDYTRREPHH